MDAFNATNSFPTTFISNFTKSASKIGNDSNIVGMLLSNNLTSPVNVYYNPLSVVDNSSEDNPIIKTKIGFLATDDFEDFQSSQMTTTSYEINSLSTASGATTALSNLMDESDDSSTNEKTIPEIVEFTTIVPITNLLTKSTNIPSVVFNVSTDLPKIEIYQKDEAINLEDENSSTETMVTISIPYEINSLSTASGATTALSDLMDDSDDSFISPDSTSEKIIPEIVEFTTILPIPNLPTKSANIPSVVSNISVDLAKIEIYQKDEAINLEDKNTSTETTVTISIPSDFFNASLSVEVFGNSTSGSYYSAPVSTAASVTKIKYSQIVNFQTEDDDSLMNSLNQPVTNDFVQYIQNQPIEELTTGSPQEFKPLQNDLLKILHNPNIENSPQIISSVNDSSNSSNIEKSSTNEKIKFDHSSSIILSIAACSAILMFLFLYIWCIKKNKNHSKVYLNSEFSRCRSYNTKPMRPSILMSEVHFNPSCNLKYKPRAPILLNQELENISTIITKTKISNSESCDSGIDNLAFTDVLPSEECNEKAVSESNNVSVKTCAIPKYSSKFKKKIQKDVLKVCSSDGSIFPASPSLTNCFIPPPPYCSTAKDKDFNYSLHLP